MKPDDKKAFLILMTMLSEAFNEPMSTERGKIYFEFLKPYQLYEVNYAIKTLIRECKFFPKISEIIKQIEPDPRWETEHSHETLEAKSKNKQALEYISQMAKMIGNISKNRQPEQIEHRPDDL